MWLALAFLSAILLGFYDVSKKQALKNNPVVPVLFLNTLFCSLIFLPAIIFSATGTIGEGSLFYVPPTTLREQLYIILKSMIVLSSWLCGYYGMKWLPLTIVGPINATRPVIVLVGAMLVFGERLNLYQWIGVILAVVSFFMLARSGKREGIDFRHNRWVFLIVMAAVFGAVSGLYDRFLMAPVSAGGVGLNRMAVQSYYNLYQCAMMGVVLFVQTKETDKRKENKRKEKNEVKGKSPLFPSHLFSSSLFSFSLLSISLFLSAADFMYFFSLSQPDAMISVVSMIRRGSVIVSFTVGAVLFREKNLRAKAFDLALVLLGMFFLYLGSR